MTGNWHISRRTALRGMGTAIALPWLEAMVPPLAAAASAATAPPVRMAFLYVPNGVSMASWTPATLGAEYALSPILEPLKAVKDDLLVLDGLTLDKARDNGDGGGDHARSLASFLTACQARKTHGANLKAGVSVDQLAAQALGKQTRFASLELGIEPGAQSGNCDSGYSCAYSYNMSWRTESTPVAQEINPRLVFERLFNRSKRDRYQKSILDLVMDDAGRLQRRVGQSDRRKLDEYLSSVRELEQRIARFEAEDAPAQPVDHPQPTGIPQDYQEHIRLMCDMLVLAFQTDVTRISTFLMAHEGSNRSYPQIGVPDGHHDLSHHQEDAAKIAKIAKINTFHTTQLAYLAQKMKAIREGERTLLDNCMIVYGSGIGDGNAHNHDNLPILLLGRGGSTIASGRHLRYPDNTPLANLHLSLLERFGMPTEKLGDSTGKLLDLTTSTPAGG